jgi:hypothetical protein
MRNHKYRYLDRKGPEMVENYCRWAPLGGYIL